VSVLRPEEDVLGFLDRSVAICDLRIDFVIFQADDADIFHALENFNDHSMVVEEIVDFGQVFLLLVEAVR